MTTTEETRRLRLNLLDSCGWKEVQERKEDKERAVAPGYTEVDQESDLIRAKGICDASHT